MADASSVSGSVDGLNAAMSSIEAEGPAKEVFQQVVLGSLAEELPVQFDEGITTVTCSECTREVESGQSPESGEA